MGNLVHHARQLMVHVLSALVLATAARFAWTAHAQWAAVQEQTPAQAQQPAAIAAPKPSAAQPRAPEAPLGKLVRVVLSVSHGERRSEVLLDGMPLGHTTYAGDVSCHLGSNVTVTIIPKQGAPIERVRRCDGQMLVVREP